MPDEQEKMVKVITIRPITIKVRDSQSAEQSEIVPEKEIVTLREDTAKDLIEVGLARLLKPSEIE